MKLDDIAKLEPGVYRVFWVPIASRFHSDGISAAIGQFDNGDRWFAPTNWSTLGTKHDWELVERVERIDKPDHTNNWRDVAADMLRCGRDLEAIALFCEHSPELMPYVLTLERLYHAVKDWRVESTRLRCKSGKTGWIVPTTEPTLTPIFQKIIRAFENAERAVERD